MIIKYNDTSTLRFEFPITWDAKAIDAVTLSVSNMDGYVLQQANCTIKTPLKLSVLAEQNDLEINLSGVVQANDWLRIEDAYGFHEDVEVESFNFTGKVATLKSALRKDHIANSDAYGLFCTASISTTSTTDFPIGEKLVLTWTPDIGMPVTERAEIGKMQFQIPNLLERFSNLYPREYDVLSDDDRLYEMLDEATKQLSTELRLRGIFIDKIVDTDLLIPVAMAKMRWLVLQNGNSSSDTERQVAKDIYMQQFELLCAADIWTDVEQDSVIDERADNSIFFERGF